MKVIWLGQAGLLFETKDVIIMIDPYFSNSVEKANPEYKRRVQVLKDVFSIKPDVMIFTHNHLDHFDMETVEKFIGTETNISVLAPKSVWTDVRRIGGNNNYILFNRGTSWTEKNVRFTAIKAEHSDHDAIGVIIDYEGKKYYITGDTLYNEEIFKDINDRIYAVFLPVNGVGNNMNMLDAKRFCERINPNYAVPVHCGMFDEIDMNKFEYERKIVPEIYKEIKFI